jgi:DNA-binding NarL/FixJ family response regulator
MMRDGLGALLAQDADLEVVGTASDGRSAVEQVRALSPDVVVMDIGLPDLNGVEATRRIKSEHDGVKVIALSMHADKRYVFHMLDAGALGYVLKSSASDELLQAVHDVTAGGTYVSPSLADYALERSANPKPGADGSVFSRLGAREREVLQLVAEGRTSAETAKEMHISVKTVETHRRNIARKLGLHSTAELTKYAVREGLTQLES